MSHSRVFSADGLVDTDTESDPEEAPSNAKESQLLGFRVPIVSEEFKAFKPLGTRTDSSYSSASSDSTTPLSPDHPLTHVSPTPIPTRASLHPRVAEVMALSDSGFRKRYRSSYETPSPTHPIRKRYRGTSELILDIDKRERESSDDEDRGLDDEGHGLEGEGLGLEGEEAAPEGQQQAVPVVGTAVSEPLGLGYKAARRCALKSMEEIATSTYEVGKSSRVYIDIPIYPPVAPVQTPLSPEWSSGSLPISPSSPVVLSPIASPVATPTTTISVDEDQFLKVGVQLELHRSILHDHTQRLDALPPTLIMDIDKDVRELYTRSGVVRDEIFLQRYMFRSLEQEQERVVVTFGALWRPVLSLEAWTGQTDAQRATLSHAIYDTQRENHDLKMQLTEERRELLELADLVARMERRQESIE
ncbi:hypothetical protein Tco_0138276 [Tanacetum coccineum]